jgi:hypothetical protein
MGYVEQIGFVKSLFPQAVEVSGVDAIDMAGTYLLVDSVDPSNSVQDKLNLVLIVAGHSLTDEVGVMPLLDGYRQIILQNRLEVEFTFIKRVEMRTSTLFSVAMGMQLLTNIS